jgi:hypothetical protein
MQGGGGVHCTCSSDVRRARRLGLSSTPRSSSLNPTHCSISHMVSTITRSRCCMGFVIQSGTRHAAAAATNGTDAAVAWLSVSSRSCRMPPKKLR